MKPLPYYFFDLRDFDPASGSGGGSVYLFEDGPRAASFRIAEGRVELDAPLPSETGDVWLGVPASMLGFRLLEFPFSDMEKIREILPFELEGLILHGPEEIILDALPLQQKILAVYALKKELKPLIEALKGAEAEPAVITSLDLAMARGSAPDIASALLEAPSAGEEARMAAARAESSGGPTVNFRRGELEFTKKKEEAARRLKTTFVLAAVLLGLFAVKSAVGLYFIHKQAAAIEEQIGRSYAKMLPGRKMQNPQVALMELDAGLASLKREGGAVSGLPALEALKTLSAHRAPGAVIREISMAPDGTVIKGRAGSLSDVTAEKNALEQGGARAAVIETGNGPGGGVLFTMSVRFAGREKKAAAGAAYGVMGK